VLDLYRTPKRTAIAGIRGLASMPDIGRTGSILTRTEAVGMTYWWKRELVVTDLGFEWDVWQFRQRVKMTLPYDRIAYVEVLWGPFADDIQVVGKASSDSLLIRGIDKDSAQRIKGIVDRRLDIGRAA
jgi:hypothetical protein